MRDGDAVALQGFTPSDPVRRQGRTELERIQMTPNVLYDRMVGVGLAGKLVFYYVEQRSPPAWQTATLPARPLCRSRCCVLREEGAL